VILSGQFGNFAFLVFRFARPCLCAQVCLTNRTQLWSTQDSFRGGAKRASISFPKWQVAGWCTVSRTSEVTLQHGYGVDDSLPSG